jgi:hypothetical protein
MEILLEILIYKITIFNIYHLQSFHIDDDRVEDTIYDLLVPSKIG